MIHKHSIRYYEAGGKFFLEKSAAKLYDSIQDHALVIPKKDTVALLAKLPMYDQASFGQKWPGNTHPKNIEAFLAIHDCLRVQHKILTHKLGFDKNPGGYSRFDPCEYPAEDLLMHLLLDTPSNQVAVPYEICQVVG